MIDLLHTHTGIETNNIQTIITLIEEGNTIPFIARYRKEATWWATDEQLRLFEKHYMYQKNLAEKKETILASLLQKEVLTDELTQAIHNATTLAELDDIYRPFKDKKNTRATKALAKWLEPLATLLRKTQLSQKEFLQKAEEYIKDTWDIKTSVATAQEALQWAQDICAERCSDDAWFRSYLKQHADTHTTLTTKEWKEYDPQWVYTIYAAYTKPFHTIPSHAYLAIARAEKEKQLSVWLAFDELHAHKYIYTNILSWHPLVNKSIPENTSTEYLRDACLDALKRLIFPSLERELRSAKKERADEQAIQVFGQNIQELFLSPPVRWKTILWFDPAYRTWCKLAVINPQWAVLDYGVIYPTKPQEDTLKSEKFLLARIKTYKIDLIVIGNGTWSRESEVFIADMIQNNTLTCKYMIASEAWASVYSASELAQQEYPNLDVTIRWAVNIAQRIQDPLATYVKIDPKSLWVWQYQHDVDQNLLKDMLHKKIEDTVNRVWTDINTASPALLQHIAWLTKKTAENIVAHRTQAWIFTKRSDIKKVAWLGPKSFEQCAWFLRIHDSKDPLDRTGIHPESYKTTYEFLSKEFNIDKKNLTLPYVIQLKEPIETYAERYDIWEQTLLDICAELARPWLDPRESFDENQRKSHVLSLEDLTIWLAVQWIVRNIVDFGVFVDIWLKNDAFIHTSELADWYVSSPFSVVHIWQSVNAKVIKIDIERKRVSLSTKHSLKITRNPQSSDNATHAHTASRPAQKTPHKQNLQPTPHNDTSSHTMSSNITFS